MCRPIASLVALLLAAPLAAQGPAPASADQALGKQLVAFGSRADSLAREWREVSALADLVDSLAHAAPEGPLDTIAEGPLRIVTKASRLPVREAARRLLPILDSLYGSATVELTARPWQILPYDPDTIPPDRRTWSAATRVPWDLDLGSLVRHLGASPAMPELDLPLRNWLSGPLRPEFEVATEAGGVYLQLVAAPFQVNRDCLAGDLSACRSALSLDPPDRAITGRYRRPEERRTVVEQGEFYFRSGDRQVAYQECLAGSDAMCQELLVLLPPAVLTHPLPPGAHRSLARLAVRLGGPGGYRRLTADSARPLAARLEQAAGVPIDSLVERWRADLLARRPPPVSLPRFGVGIGLGWVLVFGLCGLGSSRWRIG